MPFPSSNFICGTGFCKKNGVDPSSVEVRADAKGVEYVFADVFRKGRATAEVLAEDLPKIVKGLKWKKVCHCDNRSW